MFVYICRERGTMCVCVCVKEKYLEGLLMIPEYQIPSISLCNLEVQKIS